MKKPSEILTDAKSLIADKANWVQGTSIEIWPTGRVCYCALGAIDKATGGFSGDTDLERNTKQLKAYKESSEYVHRAARSLFNEPNIVYVNDRQSPAAHANVMKAFDLAIATAEGEGR